MILQGCVPVKATFKLVGDPLHTLDDPEMVAEGNAFTVIMAEPLTVPLQLASETEVSEYVFVLLGLTFMV